MDGLHNLHGGQATLRNLFGANAPDLRHVAACYGIANRALAGKLVALLAVLTTTLPIALAGNHGAARALAAQVADGKAKINHREAVLYAFGMMLQAAGVKGDGSIRLREPAGGLLDSLRRHARLLGYRPRIVRLHRLRNGLKTHGPLRNEGPILQTIPKDNM